MQWNMWQCLLKENTFLCVVHLSLGLTCVAVSLGERVQCSFGFGGPVGGAGAERAGGQRLAQVVRAHLLGVVGGRLTPVCSRNTMIS